MSWRRYLRKYRALAVCLTCMLANGLLYTNCGQAFAPLSVAGGGLIYGAKFAIGVPVANLCQPGYVALGIDSNDEAVCALLQTLAQPYCPTGLSLEQGLGSSVVCIDNGSYNRSGTICPVGESLATYSSYTDIQCAGPTALVNGVSETPSCPAGEYLQGFDFDGSIKCALIPGATPVSATPTPTPVPTPTPAPTPETEPPVTCGAGEFLYNVEDDTLDCWNAEWPAQTAFTCPVGQTLIGFNSSWQPVCQDILWSATSHASCPEGQILLHVSNSGKATCAAPPNPDLSDACGDNELATGVNASGIVCTSYGEGTAPACPPGEFVTELFDGSPTCEQMTTNSIPDLCPASEYPTGLNAAGTEPVCTAFPTTNQTATLPGCPLGLDYCD